MDAALFYTYAVTIVTGWRYSACPGLVLERSGCSFNINARYL
jgi:hypothetical protein